MKQVTVNIQISDYTNRVLGVIKEKYGLSDKGKALDKFAEIHGEEFVEPEIREDVIRDVIASTERHIKKYGYRSMPLDELRKLCGVEE